MATLGKILGFPLALFFVLGSLLRGSKALHPKGHCFLAQVDAVDEQDLSLAALTNLLKGSALVRLSNSIWKTSGKPYDMLGIAIRFHWQEGDSLRAGRRSHDLLLATVQHIWTLLFAPITTRVKGFFRNYYFSLVPFEVDGIGKVKFRLVPETRDETQYGDRLTKLANRVALGKATFILEVSKSSFTKNWRPLLRVHLVKPLILDQSQLHFSPYNSLREIKPVGFINGLRKPVYLAAQLMQIERKNLRQKQRTLSHNFR